MSFDLQDVFTALQRCGCNPKPANDGSITVDAKPRRSVIVAPTHLKFVSAEPEGDRASGLRPPSFRREKRRLVGFSEGHHG